MTITDTASETDTTEAAVEPRAVSAVETLFTSHDHKLTGRLYVRAGALLLAAAAVVGALVGMIRHATGELTAPVGFMQLRKHRQLAEDVLEALVDRGRHHREWQDEVAEDRIEDELRPKMESLELKINSFG